MTEVPCILPLGCAPWDTQPLPPFKCPFSGLTTIETPQPVVTHEDTTAHEIVDIPSSESESDTTDMEGDYEPPITEGADLPMAASEIQDFYLINHNRGTFHAIVECEPSHPRSLTAPNFQGISFRTCCASKPASWNLLSELPIGYTACEGGCRRSPDERRN